MEPVLTREMNAEKSPWPTKIAATGAGPAVILSGVTRVFGVAPAIVRIDLQVQRGEVVLVRGPNGSGKSTLLRVIATALSPSAGTGRVLGLDLLRDREGIRHRIELLGHRTRLYEDLTAAENLTFVCALYGIDTRTVSPALEQVGLGEVMGERVRGFSNGMRQRTALARLILRVPELLLLDEPYAGLDQEARRLVDGIIRDAQRHGHTVILATHDSSPAELASRTLAMHAGRLLDAPTRLPTEGQQA
jgi:heme exporter protein A